MKYQSQVNPYIFFTGCTRGEDRCITAMVKTMDSEGNVLRIEYVTRFYTYGLKRKNVQSHALRCANSVAKIKAGLE